MSGKNSAEKVRVSVGSAAVLGLSKQRLDAEPTTVYLLTYWSSKCVANCAFCPQAKTSKSRADMLSRVTWPAFPSDDVVAGITKAFAENKIERVCIQTLNYANVMEDILVLVRKIRSSSPVAISVSCQPLKKEEMVELAKIGVNRVSIALDAATKEIFEKVKGSPGKSPYAWKMHLETLEEAVKVFGKGSVSTHLIVGLGESEEDLVAQIQWCVDKGIYPSLFAFTPILGTMMEDHLTPSIDTYRRVQLAQYLITHSMAKYSDMTFKEGRLISFGISREDLEKVIDTGEPFRTSGCPGCNRPYYNERPGGLIYNYPKKPSSAEMNHIRKQIDIKVWTQAQTAKCI